MPFLRPPPPPPRPRTLRLRLRPDDASVVGPGDVVRIRALLRAPPPPDLPSGRDPQRDAFFSGLAGSGRALSPAAILSHGTQGGAQGGVLIGMRGLRERIADRIRLVLPGPRGAIAATLLTGLSSAIPQVDRDAFAASGLAHLLAVAGLHLGIVMGLALSLVRTVLAAWEWGALRLPCRQIAALAALAAGGFYMLLTGLHLPGLRSLAMAAVAMLGLVIGRRAVSLRALAFAAGLILLLTPAVLLDVAFQMSFAAVLALLAGYEAARPLMRRLQTPRLRDRMALHLFQLFFTSLVAGAASLPYAAFHFGRVQFYFVLANLLAVPLTAFWVMPQGLLSLLLMPFGLRLADAARDGGGDRPDPPAGADRGRPSGRQPAGAVPSRLRPAAGQRRAVLAVPVAAALAPAGPGSDRARARLALAGAAARPAGVGGRATGGASRRPRHAGRARCAQRPDHPVRLGPGLGDPGRAGAAP